MDRVAAEIVEEVGMLLQNRDRHAGPREQDARHHPGGSSADDHAILSCFSVRHRDQPAGIRLLRRSRAWQSGRVLAISRQVERRTSHHSNQCFDQPPPRLLLASSRAPQVAA